MKLSYTPKEVENLFFKYMTTLNTNEFVTVPYHGQQHSLFKIKHDIAQGFLIDEGIIHETDETKVHNNS